MAMTTTLLSDVGVIIVVGDEDLLAGELLGISLSLPQIFNSKENNIYFLIHFILMLDCVGIACTEVLLTF